MSGKLGAKVWVRRLLVFIAAVGTAGLVAGCSAVDQVVKDQTGLTLLAPYSDLVVNNANGSVTIQTHAQQGLQVVTEIRARTASAERAKELLDNTDIVLTQSATQAKVQSVVPKLQLGESVSTNMQIWVPVDYAGRLTVTTGNGEVRTYSVGGKGSISTGNGGVDVTGWHGSLTVDTGNGSITVRDARLVTDANTFTTGNGSVKLGLAALDAKVVGITGNGAILLTLPPNTDANLVLSATNGKIRVTSPDGSVREGKGKLQISGYGPEVQLFTTNGTVTVEGW